MTSDDRNSGEKHCYDDIINLPHHTSAVHVHMSRIDRAVQFSPFAALTGYHAAVEETARRTSIKMELSEDAKAILDERLQMLQEKIDGCPKTAITYFQPDSKKEGGAYITVIGNVKRINMSERAVIMKDGMKIYIDDIIKIEEQMSDN